MSNTQDSKSPQLEKTEPQKITPQTGEPAKSKELDAEQLDRVAGGVGGLHAGGPVGPGPGG
jgi:hypothetical protein